MTTWRAAEPARSEREPRPVADSLDRITRAFGAPRARLLASIFSRWEELVGPEIARHAQPRTLRDGVLVLTADEPAWATQLRYLAPDLLARVRADAAAPDITEVQIRIAAWPSADPEARRSGRRRAEGDGTGRSGGRGTVGATPLW